MRRQDDQRPGRGLLDRQYGAAAQPGGQAAEDGRQRVGRVTVVQQLPDGIFDQASRPGGRQFAASRRTGGWSVPEKPP